MGVEDGEVYAKDLESITISGIKQENIDRIKRDVNGDDSRGFSCYTKTATYTVKTSDGRYKKWAFTGGCKLKLHSAYQGKKAGVILLFRCPHTGAVDELGVEIPLKDIHKLTTGYQKFLRALLGLDQKKVETNEVEVMETGDYSEWGAWT